MFRCRHGWLAGAFTVALAATTPAAGAIITVDADSFVAGTNISAAFAGVALSAVGGGFGAGPSIFAVGPAAQPNEPFTASTGTLVFGTDSADFPHLLREPGFLSLRADFATPTSSVAIDVISNDAADVGFLQAFDSGNNLLGTYTSASLGTNAIETMTVNLPGIAYILAGGLDGDSSVGLDNLRFDAVPEPSVLLLGVTAAAAIARRRRPTR